jgi:integrase
MDTSSSRKQSLRRPLFPGHRPERGLLGEIDRHGNEVWYYREGHGPRTRIKGEFGSPSFIEEYKTAKWRRPSAAQTQAGTSAKAAGASRQDTNSLDWLIERFLGSTYFATELKPNTQKQRRNTLRAIARKNGAKPYRMIDWFTVRDFRDLVAKHGLDPAKPKAAPAMATQVVTSLRTLFTWAIQERLLEKNPCIGVDAVSYDKKSHHLWTDAQCDRFEQAYAIGTRERLMYSLLIYTGQRCSDVVRMGPRHIDRDGMMTIVQQKTGKEISVHILPVLEEAIAASPTGGETFITSELDGKPISAGHFSNLMRRACDAIGLPECTAHGLRHAAASRALANGADVSFLCGVFGFTLPVAAKYVEHANLKGAAKRGALHLVRNAA